VAPGSITKAPREGGVEPALDRPASRHTILQAHREELAATDLITVEVWSLRGLRTIYVLSFIESMTQRVQLSGMTANSGDPLDVVARSGFAGRTQVTRPGLATLHRPEPGGVTGASHAALVDSSCGE
jgi:hypothetical protein